MRSNSYKRFYSLWQRIDWISKRFLKYGAALNFSRQGDQTKIELNPDWEALE